MNKKEKEIQKALGLEDTYQVGFIFDLRYAWYKNLSNGLEAIVTSFSYESAIEEAFKKIKHPAITNKIVSKLKLTSPSKRYYRYKHFMTRKPYTLRAFVRKMN